MVHPTTGQPVTITLGAFDVHWMTDQALGDPRTLVTLPAAVREMAAGQAGLSYLERARPPRHRGVYSRQPRNFQRVAHTALVLRSRLGIESGTKHMMDLSSGATAARREHIRREAATALLANAINFPGMDLQDAWDATELEEDFRQPVTSDVPTLILVGDLDARIPIENANEIAATLTHGPIVVLENAAHQFDLFGSAPIRAVVGEFLRGERSTAMRLALPPLKFQQ